MENFKKSKHLIVGEISISKNYSVMTKEDKEKLSLTLLDHMLTLIDQKVKPEYNRFDVLDKLLESTIEHNEEKEEYEICEVMSSIRKLLNG
jgi:hypothetical protein